MSTRFMSWTRRCGQPPGLSGGLVVPVLKGTGHTYSRLKVRVTIDKSALRRKPTRTDLHYTAQGYHFRRDVSSWLSQLWQDRWHPIPRHQSLVNRPSDIGGGFGGSRVSSKGTQCYSMPSRRMVCFANAIMPELSELSGVPTCGP